jgi:CspA family cold shock protein
MTAKEKRIMGKVIWFNNPRGYGFIKPDDGSGDMFVHFSNIVAEPGKFKTLTAGQAVSFVVGTNKNGPQAEQVMAAEADDEQA